MKKILDAERITFWALDFGPSTLAIVTSQNSFSLISFDHDQSQSSSEIGPFIVVIKLVTLEQLYLTLFMFVEQFLILFA